MRVLFLVVLFLSIGHLAMNQTGQSVDAGRVTASDDHVILAASSFFPDIPPFAAAPGAVSV